MKKWNWRSLVSVFIAAGALMCMAGKCSDDDKALGDDVINRYYIAIAPGYFETVHECETGDHPQLIGTITVANTSTSQTAKITRADIGTSLDGSIFTVPGLESVVGSPIGPGEIETIEVWFECWFGSVSGYLSFGIEHLYGDSPFMYEEGADVAIEVSVRE